MAWPDDPLPAIRHEIHFGDRLVRCFVDRPPSLFAIFEQSLAANPDGLALIDPDQRLTYAQLAERIDRLAASLAAHGVGAGDRVALLLGNGAPFLISLLACARLGRDRGAAQRPRATAGPRLHAPAERQRSS